MFMYIKETIMALEQLTPYQRGLLFSELAETKPVLADNIRQIIEETLEELKA
jgi:hypothetical protein